MDNNQNQEQEQKPRNILQLGGIGKRLVFQIGRSAVSFLATNPWLWVIIGTIIVIGGFTIIVVLSFPGAPSSETPMPNQATPIPSPTFSP